MKTVIDHINGFYHWYDSHGHGFRLGFVLLLVLILSLTDIFWQVQMLPGKGYLALWAIVLLVLLTRMSYIYGWFKRRRQL